MNPTEPDLNSPPQIVPLPRSEPYVLHRGLPREWRGWFSDDILLEDESAEEFLNFRKEFYRVLEPEPGFVSVLFDYLVVSAWRLRRIVRMEAGLWNCYEQQGANLSRDLGFGGALLAGKKGNHFLQHLGRYESALRRNYNDALKLLLEWRVENFFPYAGPMFLPEEAFWDQLGLAPNERPVPPEPSNVSC